MIKPPKILFVTPAAPGYYALSLCYDEGGAIYDAAREPVVAWALDEVGSNYPVTMNVGMGYGEGVLAILCPDGQVQSIDRTWNSLGEWLREQKSEGAA